LTIAQLRIDGDSFSFGRVTAWRWAANRRAKRWARRLSRLDIAVTLTVATRADDVLATPNNRLFAARFRHATIALVEIARHVRHFRPHTS
jgi:hypothetical protein